MCGACVAACTSHEVSKGFLGPAALAKAARFLSDPREAAASKLARLVELEKENGIWDCVRCNFCVEVCPKDVKPMEAIIRLRRAALEAGLTSSGGGPPLTGFSPNVAQEGRPHKAPMPPKIRGVKLKSLVRGGSPRITKALEG